MTDDFRRGLHELSLEVTERHGRQPGLSVPHIARAARGRRRRHESLVVAGSAAVLALVAVTGFALLDRPDPTPAPPAQTSTPTPDQSARALAPKDHPSEPDAWVMTDDVWDSVGPGWALTVFSTVAFVADDLDGYFDPAGTQTLFLVGPDRATYRLHDVPADGEASVMWWDPAQRHAWLFLRKQGEFWSAVDVDLRDGSQSAFTLGPSSRAGVPVLQQANGRVLWADADPDFPAPVEGLYWQQGDGSFVPLARGAGIEGDVWLDPDRDRVVFLSGAVDDLALTTIDLTDDSTTIDPLGAAPSGSACSLAEVLAASVIVSCDGAEQFRTDTFEVTPDGTWSGTAEREASVHLIHHMLLCGAPELPWSPAGRVLSAPLAAQGWSDASVLAAPGAALDVPKKGASC